jgi:hypothetical protein
VILEMVLKPFQDWGDSSGGDGHPFDGVPGNGTVDANDIWIEVSNPLSGMELWQVRLTDATGATASQSLGVPLPTGGVKVISGFGALTFPIVKVEVVDNLGFIRQTLDIQLIEQALGPATGVNDESLTWSVYGLPTAVLQQFIRRPSTIGVYSPF